MTLSLSAITGSGTNDASGASLAASSVTATAGSMLFVHVGWVDSDNTFNVSSVTDGKNTWFPARAKTRNATQQYSTQLWYAFGVQAGATVVTANFSAATTFRRIGVREALSSNGSFWTDPLDQTNSGTGTSNAPSAGAVVPTRDGELVVACAAITTGTLGAGAGGFTLSVAPSVNVAMEHLIQTTAASATGAFTSTLSDNWCAQVASFKDVQPPPQYNRLPPPCVIYQLVLAVASRDAGVPTAVEQLADATLNVVAALTVDAASDKPVAATLTGTATITPSAASTKPVDATLTGTATVTVAAASTKPVDTTLTGTATITAAAASDKPIASTLTATATITPAAASTKPVDATLTATASRTVAADSTKPVAATLTNTATITAAAASTKPVDATRSTTATITVSAASDKPVSATLTNTATITVDASIGTPPKTFDVTAPFVATITTAVTSTKPVDATLAATATITADASVGTPGVVDIAATLGITATIIATAMVAVGAYPVLVTASTDHPITTGTEDERWLTTSATRYPSATRSMTLPVSSRTPP